MQQESLRSLGTKFLDHDGFYKVYYTLHEFEELQTHLILQILGLTWTNIRKKLVAKVGEKIAAEAQIVFGVKARHG